MSRHMQTQDIRDLACRLARDAETVCRRYLSRGKRQGRYWIVGDVRNASGRSLYVRLIGPERGKGAAGRWTDAATGEYGDLLDIIGESCGLRRFADVVDEARRFLNLPRPEPEARKEGRHISKTKGSPLSARRLFALSRPIAGTLAERYLYGRGITLTVGLDSLRFHPRCYYRADEHSPVETWPAMIAAVTDVDGAVMGAHRTWLDPASLDKAPVDTPRRAMGQLLGHAVRFGWASEIMAVGEGNETMLSLRCVMPSMSMAAALSSAHLAAFAFSDALRRLYIARDNDVAGDRAAAALADRAMEAGIEPIELAPVFKDFNEDLRELGVDALREGLRGQLHVQDVARFLEPAA